MLLLASIGFSLNRCYFQTKKPLPRLSPNPGLQQDQLRRGMWQETSATLQVMTMVVMMMTMVMIMVVRSVEGDIRKRARDDDQGGYDRIVD